MQRSLAIVALFAALGGFLFGYDLGLIGGAILVIKEEFGTSSFQDACIVGAAKVGAFIGVFLGGAYMYRHGRKAAILADSVFFILGPLVMASAVNIGALILGRLLVGMGIGFSAVVVPAYLGEVAPPKVRGSVVILYELMLCVGMVVSSLADAALQGVQGDWRWMVGLPVVPGLVLALAPLVLPESPRWLVMAGDLPSALAALHRIRCSQPQKEASRSTSDVEDELMTLWNAVERDHASWRMRNSTFFPQPRTSPTTVQLQACSRTLGLSELHEHSPCLQVPESQLVEASVEGSGMLENVQERSPRKWRQHSKKNISVDEHVQLLDENGAFQEVHLAQASAGVFLQLGYALTVLVLVFCYP